MRCCVCLHSIHLRTLQFGHRRRKKCTKEQASILWWKPISLIVYRSSRATIAIAQIPKIFRMVEVPGMVGYGNKCKYYTNITSVTIEDPSTTTLVTPPWLRTTPRQKSILGLVPAWTTIDGLATAQAPKENFHQKRHHQ